MFMPTVTSVANVKEAGRISGTADDTLIGNLIDRAEAMTAKVCGRDAWAQATYSAELHEGNDTDVFVLRNTPIELASPAPVITIRTGATSTRTVGTGEYRIEPDTGSVYRIAGAYAGWPADGLRSRRTGPVWPTGRANLSAAYTGGYDTIPDDLEALVIEQVLHLYAQTDQTRGVSAEAIGAWSVTYDAQAIATAVLPSVMAGLKAAGYWRGLL